MSYLIAKYFILFLLTAIVSFILGHWWARRRMIDVTESYRDIRTQFGSLDGRLEDVSAKLAHTETHLSQRIAEEIAGIPTPPEPDLSAVITAAQASGEEVKKLPASLAGNFSEVLTATELVHKEILDLPPPTETDLQPLMKETSSIQRALQNAPAPQETDLSGVLAAIAALPAPEAVNLSGLESQLKDLQAQLDNLPQPQQVDLAPLQGSVDALKAAIDGLEMPEATQLGGVESSLNELRTGLMAIPTGATEPDLNPVMGELATLRQEVAALRGMQPTTQVVDVSPLEGRLSAIEALLGKLNQPPPPPPEPDDLKRISGVAGHLESLLHKHGIKYFWQIAGWSAADIVEMDDKLQFKGRIQRDNWVEQATRFAAEPGSAPKPS